MVAFTSNGEAKFTAFDDLLANSEEVTVQISLSYNTNSIPRARVRDSLHVLRGRIQPITTKQIELLTSNIQKETTFKKPQIQKIYFDKPKCGEIMAKTSDKLFKESSSFALSDLANGAIYYNQTNEKCSSDFIISHIQDDFVELRLGIPVNIIPRATKPPGLVYAKRFVVRQALQFTLTRRVLLAKPADNSTENRCRKCVTYRIVDYPKFGQLETVLNNSLNSKLEQFTQNDVDRGFIRYQHNGRNIRRDKVLLRLEDDEDNVGKEFEIQIYVKPYSPEKIANSLPDANIASLNESDFLILSEKYLKYKYQKTSDKDIEYVVVKPPYFLETDGTKTPIGDAGRLVIFSSPGNVPARRSSDNIIAFTQSDVKHGRVAYFAPSGEIGSRARVAQFVFDVNGPEGVAKSQVFKINILPINNRPPRVHETALKVKAGESVNLLPTLQIEDVDSPLEKLTIAIEQTPRHGHLLYNDTTKLRLGDKIPLQHLDRVTYKHSSHSSDRADSFRLMAFDGQYHSSGTITVDIQQPDVLDKIFLSFVNISENGNTSLLADGSQEFIGKQFRNSSMKFLVVRPPYHGKLLLDGKETRRFYTRDLMKKDLQFSHPANEESGWSVLEDSLTILGIASSADLQLDSHQLMLRTISISILPENNKSPRLEVVGLPQTMEGGVAEVDSTMIFVDDIDSETSDLFIEIISIPRFGCIFHKYGECYETGQKINVTEFKSAGFAITYNHTTNSGTEESSDQFEIRAGDGKHFSETKSVAIEILPESDEMPTVTLKTSNEPVFEGGEINIFDMFSVEDKDKPLEVLSVTFKTFPEFGYLTLTRDDGSLLMISNGSSDSFTIRPDKPLPKVIYHHDGSENFVDNLEIIVSDGKYTVGPVKITISIIPVDDELPRLVKAGNDGEIIHVVKTGEKHKFSITSNELHVEDLDSKPNEILFSLLEKPTKIKIHLDNVEAESFTQSDIDNGRISLLAPENFSGAMVNDKLKFSVVSGEKMFQIPSSEVTVAFIKESAINIIWNIAPNDFNKAFNREITELQSLRAENIFFISKNFTGEDCFDFSDSSFTSQDLKDENVQAIPGLQFDSSKFCQKLQQVEIRYLPSNILLGYISVNFTAVKQQEAVTKPPKTEPITELEMEEPDYDVVQQPGVIERLAKRVYGFVLTREHLQTVAEVGGMKKSVDGAMYEVSRNPKYGILADLSATTSSLDSLRKFTQAQIDSKQIVYVLTKLAKSMTTDWFDFSVSNDDSTGISLLENQRFMIEWSFLEFEQVHLVACRKNDTVKIATRRLGFVNGTAKVQIRIRIPQKKGLKKQIPIEFSPGTSVQFVDVQVDPDVTSLRVYLRSPVNTLLGSTKKALVKIIDNEKCSEHGPQKTSLIEPIEAIRNEDRIVNLRREVLGRGLDSSNKRPSRSSKQCQNGWFPLASLGKVCYTELPITTHFNDAHRRCKSLGGHLPLESNLSNKVLTELSQVLTRPIYWIDAPHSNKNRRRSVDKSCAVVRNSVIAPRRCSVAKARVVCFTDL